MTEAGFLGCCGSTKFSREMALRAPVSSLDLAVEASRDIWRNKVIYFTSASPLSNFSSKFVRVI
jgi:hypothetical protein